jgi:threonine/homoserine/homoserine lactone efflux protein
MKTGNPQGLSVRLRGAKRRPPMPQTTLLRIWGKSPMVPSMNPLISFLIYAFVVAITPGPNNIISMNNARSMGVKRNLPLSIGIFIGYAIIMCLCFFFSRFLFAWLPQIALPMRVAGAAYMLFIIVRIWLPAKRSGARASGGNFFVGVFLGLINPKFVVFGITATSSYILRLDSSVPRALFALTPAFIASGATVCWAAFGAGFSALFGKHGTLINAIMSLLLLYCAVSLFLPVRAGRL